VSDQPFPPPAPTHESVNMSTHELVWEIALYEAAKEFGDESIRFGKQAEDRLVIAKTELSRRFKQSWIATGDRKGGE